MKRLLILFIGGVLLSSFARFYPATVTKAYDGDTITLTIDLGMGISMTERVRLYGINAPELRGSERVDGLKSRDALRKLILNKEVRLETLKNDKKGKYGRLIGIIYVGDINVNKWMVKNNYAVEKYY